MFEYMLLNSFQKNGNHKFIFGIKKDFLEIFNLFVEIGINIFKHEYSKKEKSDQKIYPYTKFQKSFQRMRWNLSKLHKRFIDKTWKKDKKNITIPEDNVFMIASNSTYENFYNRFYDKKIQRRNWKYQFKWIKLILIWKRKGDKRTSLWKPENGWGNGSNEGKL